MGTGLRAALAAAVLVQPLAARAAHVLLDGLAAPPASSAVCGFSLVAREAGPQLALMNSANLIAGCVEPGERIDLVLPLPELTAPAAVLLEATLPCGGSAEVRLSLGGASSSCVLQRGSTAQLQLQVASPRDEAKLQLTIRGLTGQAGVRCRDLRLQALDVVTALSISTGAIDAAITPPPPSPALRPPIEEALIEWDWRMQDGIGTSREPVTYAEAAGVALGRGDALLGDLDRVGANLDEAARLWRRLGDEWRELSTQTDVPERRWEDLWRRVHVARRRMVLSAPPAPLPPIVFVKQPPSSFSHQLTQYLGCYARPGGGLFVLEAPGESMRCRPLASEHLPLGSYQQAEVSYDGRRVLFAYCQTSTAPAAGLVGDPTCRFHLYEIQADGSRLRRLTDGPYDDFSPRYLPDGRIVFVSTRRGGWHRCGGSPGQGCQNHTLALAEADGSNPRPISFHETQEWDPAVLDDGRVIYTRWDYVDRHAVYYEQLWTTRPDGGAAMIYYGNNTLNPVGIWEAQQVPGSTKVMATAAAHHAMTAGSIILVDVSAGVDGARALERLTPDAPFPESESRLPPRGWHAPAGVAEPPVVPVEARRWPGHCYRTPYPFSERCFLAAYSFDPLIGEPDANRVNMFGIYLVDRFGNKELLYRDLNIASLWPTPLQPRPVPPRVQTAWEASDGATGRFLVQNVYDSDPPLPPGSVKRLRVLQVLPKSTPGINWPRLGLPNASPGKQVLGTAPVEEDGSAYFRAPSGRPLAFQALDERGRALQVMRSLVYLQPGETMACAGCHERRGTAPAAQRLPQALLRSPSTIEPGPEGSNPLSYPLLVQPVLERHCVRCHHRGQADGGVILTGEAEGSFTASYNALAPRVAFSAWGGRPGDFREVNSEPLSRPGFFGAVNSPLMRLLMEGHYQAALPPEDIERLATWMDANALFYGTFNHRDQQRQLSGERIAGPDLQ